MPLGPKSSGAAMKYLLTSLPWALWLVPRVSTLAPRKSTSPRKSTTCLRKPCGEQIPTLVGAALSSEGRPPATVDPIKTPSRAVRGRSTHRKKIILLRWASPANAWGPDWGRERASAASTNGMRLMPERNSYRRKRREVARQVLLTRHVLCWWECGGGGEVNVTVKSNE